MSGITLLMTLEISHQQSSIQSTLRGVNSVFSPDQSVVNFCSAATRLQRRRRKSRLRRYTLPRPVCESSFFTINGSTRNVS